jgi:transcriptional regulator
MYVPPANAMPHDADLRAFVAEVGAAQLVTVGAGGYPAATLLPVIWSGDQVIAHLAKANPHWRAIEPDTPALFVCQGHQAYISPSWYAAKAEHGRVVPTWNYSAVELKGTVTVFHDPDHLREAVTLLTDHHERRREHPWAVTDAPAAYIRGQLRGIVGILMRVESATGKAKLSQNRSEADRDGVIAGLLSEPNRDARAVGHEMQWSASNSRRSAVDRPRGVIVARDRPH